MSAQILSGKEVAEAVKSRVRSDVAALKARGVDVGLATVLVGDDPASHTYVRFKHRDAEEVGITSIDVKLPADATQAQVLAAVDELNARPDVSGMIVQLPLPDHLDGEAAVERVLPTKDADGLHPFNLGRLLLDKPAPLPATPSGVMTILDHYGIDVSGMTAVVVGRSFLVGRPMALMLGAKGVDATVIQAHSRTPDLAEVCRSADLLITAVGRPGMFDASYVKPGAIVIDVGTNRTDDGLVGDVAFGEVVEIAGAITPVPGGVGPMTRASLLTNTVALATAASS
ncbi:MAG: bifunctional 5,10-methylenetetrahydrofolate dehydrogenase/5,10-methenyltetrahydrofolate cyclohydrolase [Armatimonadetes bacterium]|nr:MAG: bifunctional 5,10-methylenetetrahydrofolate dehydrogenase/5,10-methenyltetrahydrofolate cyclohydrolase [Armatimonadota bacterium]